jgi:hypothetical protein
MEGYVPVATLLTESTHENGISVRRLALATGDLKADAVLALDLGQKAGWALRSADRAIASGTAEFESARFEGGGNADVLALLYLTSALGGL